MISELLVKNYRKILFWSVFILIFFLSLYLFFILYFILALSVLISLVLDPAVSYLETRRFNRQTATFIVFTTLGVLFYVVFSFFIPKIADQMSALGERLRAFSIQEQILVAETNILKYFPFLSKGVISHRIELGITHTIDFILNEFAGILTNLFSIIAIMVILPFTTFFIVKDRQRILKGLLNILPNRYFEMSYWIMKKVSYQLGRYVRGWIIDAIFVGAACGIGFWLLGIENSFALGVIAGVGHLVPYFGPIIGGIPAIFISLLQFGNLSALPLILLLMGCIYAFDNGVLQPYVFSKSVGMHPLVIILLIIAGSQAAGLPGMLFAVPFATVIKTASSEIYFALKNYKIARL